MKNRIFTAFAVVVLLSLMIAPAASASQAPSNTSGFPIGPLKPGATVQYEQKIPINIVFIGYGRNAIDRTELLSQLPPAYKPVVRYPQFYGLQGRNMGLKYTYDYKVTFASPYLTSRFFNYLKQIGKPGDPTAFQLAYNDQTKNVLDVTGPVLYIDGPSVENWLARNLIRSRGYTIVFVNWYSRPDFK